MKNKDKPTEEKGKTLTLEDAIKIQKEKFNKLLEEKLENLKAQIAKSPGQIKMDEHI
jgi:anti-sigma28 factor (negative regulator of flagellin synthesis)